jgi:GT2 family glycosyltransferase
VLRHISADGIQTDVATLSQHGSGISLLPRLKIGELSGALIPYVESASHDADFEIAFVTDDQPATAKLRVNYIFCTFKRAKYIKHNTGIFLDYLRKNRAAGDAHLTIVDNGHDGSFDGGPDVCGITPSTHISVLPNKNTGGAGGFGRGIFESCNGVLRDKGFSHLCLLDDDIHLHPEMFARNTEFLRFLKPGFHVGAPMYPLSEDNGIPRRSACFGHQHLGSVHPSDTALGANLDVEDIPAFLQMNRKPDSTGWWWNCIATADIKRIGMPYPFFIKMDDVEYSLRLQSCGVELVVPISFWVLHDDFEEKYSASMQYFRFRNRWVMLAQNGQISDINVFIGEFDRLVREFVSERKYEHAQLLLDAMRDMLRGPEHLVQEENSILSRVFSIVKEEKNKPMHALPEGALLQNNLQPSANPRNARWTERTWNNHFMPFGERIGIDTTRSYHVTACRRAKQVTYWNPHKNVGFTVQRQSIRAFKQMLLLKRLRNRISREFPDLLPRYRHAKLRLTSAAFWSKYGPHGTKPPVGLAATVGRNIPAPIIPQASEPPEAVVTEPDAAVFNALRNRYLGQRCFILGNGPSLEIADLNRLKNEVTFAANKIYLCFDQTEWRPTFYSVEDLLVAQNCKAEIMAMDRTTKIFAHHMLPYLPRQANHHYTRWLPPLDNRSPHREFSTDLTKGICWGSTITYSMLQMAVHMGFKEIYILGLDHSYVEPKNKRDGALISEGEVNHFHPEYRKPGEKWHYPVLDRLELSYQHAKDYCDTIDVKIYNASRFSKLETFPRANLDQVLNNANVSHT